MTVSICFFIRIHIDFYFARPLFCVPDRACKKVTRPKNRRLEANLSSPGTDKIHLIEYNEVVKTDLETADLENNFFRFSTNCVKSVRIGSYFGPYFVAFGPNSRIQSECCKIRTIITTNTDKTFHAVTKS